MPNSRRRASGVSTEARLICKVTRLNYDIGVAARVATGGGTKKKRIEMKQKQ